VRKFVWDWSRASPSRNWLASKRPTSTVSREISGCRPKSYSGVAAGHKPAHEAQRPKLSSSKDPGSSRQLDEALIASLTDHDRDRARTSRWDRRAHRVSETIYQRIYPRRSRASCRPFPVPAPKARLVAHALGLVRATKARTSRAGQSDRPARRDRSSTQRGR